MYNLLSMLFVTWLSKNNQYFTGGPAFSVPLTEVEWKWQSPQCRAWWEAGLEVSWQSTL